MLPGDDGVQILHRLKNSSELSEIPVIMATAKSMEYDKIKTLDMGADDYLVKPFGMLEMVSRIKAVLRRCKLRAVMYFALPASRLMRMNIRLLWTGSGLR